MAEEETHEQSIGTHQTNCLMVVAIDLGTSNSGYAFSFNQTDIIMYKRWGACVGIPVSFKAPTCVLTDADDKFVAFGYEAQKKYCDMTPEQTAQHHLYEQFKMQLHNKVITRAMTLTSVSGHTCEAIEIFAMTISYMKEHVLGNVETSTGKRPQVRDIQWVLTVPAIWSDKAKMFMREAAFKAGLLGENMYSSQLLIALEPEAASLSCCCLDSNMSKMTPGTKYLVIDGGGGTLDVTAHKVLQDNKLAELYQATGGNLGATCVDEEFQKLLQRVFGKEVIKRLKKEAPADWLNMMVNFDRVKCGYDPADRSGFTNISISAEFADCYNSVTGKSIKKAISSELEQKGVSFGSGMLRLSCKAMDTLFRPVVNGVVSHIQKLLREPVLQHIDKVLLVGGFAECRLLQHTLKAALGNRYTLMVPDEASQSVLKGAVLFGFRPSSIVERVARKTYGCQECREYDDKIHNPRKRIVRDGTILAWPVFYKFVTKGEKIKIGDKKTLLCQPPEASSKQVFVKVFTTHHTNPVYTDEPDMEELGEISIPLPGWGLDRSVNVTITFGSTEILARVIDPRPGGQQAIGQLDFLSQ